MPDLYKLVYTSSRKSSCNTTEIENILASCRKNNPSKNITGVLLHSDRRFIQYLEGDKDEIMGLFEAIKGDDRHGGVNLRYYSPIENRLFPSWHMGYKNVSTNHAVFQTSINSDDQAIFKRLIEDQNQNEVEGIRVLKLFFEMA
ncbi:MULTISPECIES: BLUF domain-containing protein [unclassified Aureispira]|uniref:BLUF domain-containing protein n=1 Tax=unclassified Aureispira TaxID=2649989 RepID=UPI000697D624|nr:MULTISPECIES: BLUF domain-containing protein [unclassified Aureispira]WMX14064.1 BLUF domain-containing protein [Aureispira sp. CCB-E]